MSIENSMGSSSVHSPDLLPLLHDGRLIGIAVLPDKRCVVILSDHAGSIYRMSLTGIVRLRADNFREGNIILDVTAETGDRVEEREILFALSVDDADKHPDFVKSVLQRVRNRDLYLVHINPSYGCTFACLCGGWTVTESENADFFSAV
jgi:hypothetical protein